MRLSPTLRAAATVEADGSDSCSASSSASSSSDSGEGESDSEDDEAVMEVATLQCSKAAAPLVNKDICGQCAIARC
ncbi:hypothetical protein HaLaN_13081, partial [Haematococcus lacustris]